MKKGKIFKILLIGIIVIVCIAFVSSGVNTLLNNEYKTKYEQEKTTNEALTEELNEIKNTDYYIKNLELRNQVDTLNSRITSLTQEKQSLENQLKYFTEQSTNKDEIITELTNRVDALNKQIEELNAQIDALENELLEQVNTMTFNATTNEANNLIAEISVLRTLANSCYTEISNLNLEISKDKFYAMNYIKNGTQNNFTSFNSTYLENEQCTVVSATDNQITLRLYAYDYTNIVKVKITGLAENDNITLNIQDADLTKIVYWQDADIKRYILVENNTINLKVDFMTAYDIGFKYSGTPTEEQAPTLYNPIVNCYINGVEFKIDTEQIIFDTWIEFNMDIGKSVYSGCKLIAYAYEEDNFVISNTNLKINNEAMPQISIKSDVASDNTSISINGNEYPLTINFEWNFESI